MWSQNASTLVGMMYQKRFRVQVAHDDHADSHDAAMDPDGLWKRFLLAFASSTNTFKSFYMSLTRFPSLKRNGFLPALFYYGDAGTSAKGDAGDWGKAGHLDTQNGEGWHGVSRPMDEAPWRYRVCKPLALSDSLRMPSWDTYVSK